jgi:gamma-glutamyltranspeptidase
MRLNIGRQFRRTGLVTAALVAPGLAPAQTMMRPDVMGREAAVVSDHVLASNAGAAVLRRGGNAVDAAITMAAVRTRDRRIRR